MSEEPLIIKVVLLGETGVGKTCILSRYISNTFKPQLLSTPGANFVTKNVESKDKKKAIKFEIWDTAGQEKYRALTKVFYNNAKVYILVYDITSKSTFDEIKNYWVNEIKEYSSKNKGKPQKY
jgi:small GTP-binding protein